MIFIKPRFEHLNKFVKISHCNYKVINIFYLSQFKMMNSTSGVYQNPISSSIEPYYVKGDVFKRDQRYYDQVYSVRRNRTPNKGYPLDASNISRGNQGLANTVPSGPSFILPNNQGSLVSPGTNTYLNQTTFTQDAQQLKRLRQQNLALSSQLQKLSTGGEFGTGDAVTKMGHYTASRTQNATIRQQQQKIRSLQDQIRLNNQKLIKYQRASNQLEIRMNNIQAIDKQIYKQLKGASTRDKQLLERANSALARGQPRQSVIRILEQIVIS